ncbi:MAG: dihydropteroate synthase [Anaerolineaceae bacterium]
MTPEIRFGDRTYIMGILNLTPDSFSGDGLTREKDPVKAALDQAVRFAAEGADILDIGGESTRPGADPVSVEEELARVLPVVKAVAAAHLDVIISIDTYKARVARACLEAGANWINDVWALEADPEIGRAAAESGATLILMHNRSKASQAILGRYVGVTYENLLEEVKTGLLTSARRAMEMGVKKEKIILDPGIGFGKTTEQNLELLNRLDEIRALGYPVLLGPSRKSFVGYTLDLPPADRLEGTAAAVTIGIMRGADVIRVHDVKAMARVAKMTDAILRAGKPTEKASQL